MEQINKISRRQKLAAYKKDPLSLALFLLVHGAAIFTFLILLFLLFYIVAKGLPNLSWDLFSWEYDSENVSLLPPLVNTLLMTMLSLLIAAPISIFSAIYLVEYARKGNKFVALIRLTAETLSGIPSIIYGLFGLLFFVTALDWGFSLLAGAFTLSIMILPLIMRTTEEALKSVDDSYREGSFALGAGRLRTVFRIVLPAAMPGILAGLILAIGRVVGETAALIYTAGTVPEIASGKDFLFDSARTLSVHMYNLSSEGLHLGQAYATALVLLIIVIFINWFSAFVAKKIGRGI